MGALIPNGNDAEVIARRGKNLFESCSYNLVIVTNGNAYHCLSLNFPGIGKSPRRTSRPVLHMRWSATLQ